LSALGQVINALTVKNAMHVPYRDSKLTRLLSESLGGNSKTCLVITCSPHPYNEEETISTMRFGSRARCIKNKPKVNREYTVPELKKLLETAS
jgi:kinesin family protein 5